MKSNDVHIERAIHNVGSSGLRVGAIVAAKDWRFARYLIGMDEEFGVTLSVSHGVRIRRLSELFDVNLVRNEALRLQAEDARGCISAVETN